jgi:AcrR family transcriptional regulator
VNPAHKMQADGEWPRRARGQPGRLHHLRFGPERRYTHNVNIASHSEPHLTLRARLKEATRAAILDAAARVFESDGAASARMEDVAAAAGIAVGTLYNYFEDRAALVAALLDQRTGALMDALDAAGRTPAAKDAPGFRLDLARFVSALARHFDANRALLHVFLSEQTRLGATSAALTRRQTVLQELHERARVLVARGIRTKALRNGDPAMLAALLLGLVRGIVQTALTEDRKPLEDRVEELVDLFLHGAAR